MTPVLVLGSRIQLVSATLTFGKRGTAVASWLFSPSKARGTQMRDYTQLTSEERYQIEALLKADHNQTEIASVLKRHKSTISREVGRNRGFHGYRPHASLVHTLTSDNGKEFSHHQVVAEELNADGHFAHPCHS